VDPRIPGLTLPASAGTDAVANTSATVAEAMTLARATTRMLSLVSGSDDRG